MGEIHQIVLLNGKAAARQLVAPEDKKLVDIASSVMASENQDLGIAYSGFAVVSLPHRRLPDDAIWVREGRSLKLIVEPGVSPLTHKRLGVPFGAKARMILLYLQTQAVKTGSQEIELGRSMNDWLDRMGISGGGKSYKIVRDQMMRLSFSSMMFSGVNHTGERMDWKKEAFVSGGSFYAFAPTDNRQPSLWSESLRLSDSFYEALRDHPVPLLDAAIRALSDDSAGLDIYVWLAYRLRSLERATNVSWKALHAQFGGGYKHLYQFKPRFVDALKRAVAAYPEARLDITADGLILRPSQPPIAELKRVYLPKAL
jgi:hypothetical protein|nr:replication protein RepA [uncultured Dongia sp.]